MGGPLKSETFIIVSSRKALHWMEEEFSILLEIDENWAWGKASATKTFLVCYYNVSSGKRGRIPSKSGI